MDSQQVNQPQMILPNQPMQQPVAQPMAQPMQQPMQQPVVQQPVMQQPMAQQPVQPNTNAAGIGSAAMVANQVTPTSPNNINFMRFFSSINK